MMTSLERATLDRVALFVLFQSEELVHFLRETSLEFLVPALSREESL